MRASLVVRHNVSSTPYLGLADAVVDIQIHLFVFHTPPEPFHEYVIPPAALSIHADLDTVVLQQARKVQAGELAALVGVEDFWRTIACNRALQGFNTEVGRQRVGPRSVAAESPVAGQLVSPTQLV